MSEVIKTDEAIVTEPIKEVVKEEPSVVTIETKPSLADILSMLKEAGEENLMALEPVKALVETARKQEKDKLYKTLEQREQEAKEFKEKFEQAQVAIDKHTTANLTIEERLEAQLEALRGEHEALVTTLRQEKEDALKKALHAELEAYKAEKLRVAGEEIIPELVGGTTKEEIDQSVETAVAKYHEIASKFETKAKEDKQKAVKSTTKVVNPSSQTVQPLTAEEIARMSPEEYAKNRDRILEAVRLGVIQ
jgi:hypothetical protein